MSSITKKQFKHSFFFWGNSNIHLSCGFFSKREEI